MIFIGQLTRFDNKIEKSRVLNARGCCYHHYSTITTENCQIIYSFRARRSTQKLLRRIFEWLIEQILLKMSDDKINRVVCKQGAINVTRENISDKSLRYLRDIFTTYIDVPWRWVFVIFAGHYVVSWFLFGSMWFIQAVVHGDIDYYSSAKSSQHSFKPCAREIYSFASAYLFSIETQQSIGKLNVKGLSPKIN